MCFARFFFFNDTATTEIYTLSLHDALPILIISRLPGFELRWLWWLSVASVFVQLVLAMLLLRRGFSLRAAWGSPLGSREGHMPISFSAPLRFSDGRPLLPRFIVAAVLVDSGWNDPKNTPGR